MDSQDVSLRLVLNQIISRFGLRDVVDLPMYDILSWMGEAIRHIGGYNSLETTSKKVQVTNHIGKLPQDLHAIIRIEGYPKFKLERTHFVVPLESGEVNVIYDRFPVDEDGIPTIPDNPSMRDAIMWYVVWYLSLQDLLPNKLSPQYCESQWQWYCGQARAEGYVPSIDQWERMVNVFYRLIPLNNEYENEFKNLQDREILLRDRTNEYGVTFK